MSLEPLRCCLGVMAFACGHNTDTQTPPAMRLTTTLIVHEFVSFQSQGGLSLSSTTALAHGWADAKKQGLTGCVAYAFACV